MPPQKVLKATSVKRNVRNISTSNSPGKNNVCTFFRENLFLHFFFVPALSHLVASLFALLFNTKRDNVSK